MCRSPLTELPLLPLGKTGWPWTEESPPLPATMSNGSPWPKISVVTPSYNQGEFIEETIRSVLLQRYPNLEYFVMDGGSTDNTVGIIKKYDKWITDWVSEPDRGQTHAINKGFDRSSGALLAWLNSDDLLAPEALKLAALYFSAHPKVGMIYGDRKVIDQNGSFIRDRQFASFKRWQFRFMSGISQETAFWRRDLFFKLGRLDEQLIYAMDYDLWWRFSKTTKIHYLPVVIGMWRSHLSSKSVIVANDMIEDENAERMRAEVQTVQKKYLGRLSYSWEKQILKWVYFKMFKWETCLRIRKIKQWKIHNLLRSVGKGEV